MELKVSLEQWRALLAVVDAMKFENPVTLRCFGEPIRITNHGPHPWVGDFTGDGKPDIVACVEWSVFPLYRYAALMMKQRPSFKIGTVTAIRKLR